MATKLRGRINLSKTKEVADLIQKDKNGDSCIWVNIYEKDQPDQYGNTHVMTVRSGDKTIYLGNFRPEGERQQQAAAPVPAQQPNVNLPEPVMGEGEDLPF